jgi:hypothetical protein
MHFKEFLPGAIWENKAFLTESVNNPIYSRVMNIDINFLKFVGNLFTAPKIVLLLHLKNQFFDISGDGFSPRSFMFIAPVILNESTLPV